MEVDNYIIAVGADEKKVIFGSDPLAGTKTGILDTRWEDKQFAAQLEAMKAYERNMKDPILKTKTQKDIHFMGNVAKFISGVLE